MIAIICGVSFVTVLLIGVYTGRKVKGAEEWANGGKNLSWFSGRGNRHS